ncbi:MAG: VCBS repeat-containing protein [Rubripirellula sp.]|nr:VCBS repeat-containing protein [Rubripirellula sp.]
MKINSLVLTIAISVIAVDASAQGKRNKAATPQLKWRVQQLHQDNNEGLAVGDIDGDGKLDITAGEFWYQAPDFKQRPVRELTPFGDDYLSNNSEHLYDMDSDGDLDVLAGTFKETLVNWYENPGKGNYDIAAWPVHRLVDTGTASNEATFLHDIDGDGTPEFIENSWNAKNPTLIFRLVKGEDGRVNVERHVVSESGNGHGMGFGDINGDGKQDIVFQAGWYEQPETGAFTGPWKYHHDFDLPHASCPILIVDLNQDGRKDLVWADGHSYGLYWHEQLEPQADGTTTWRQHMIDKKFSQGHALAWDDIDNDGQPELITGKRYYGHSGRDAGAEDDITVQFYDWAPNTTAWKKHLISTATAGEGPGIGLQIRVHDLDDNGWKDIIVPGKSGTHIIWNEGK